MAHERKYTSIILKKQPFGEADEIITLYTLETGKLRVLAKSTKAAKSKLQHALQSLFLVDIIVAGSRDFPKVIGADVKETFFKLRENLGAVKHAFYAVELALKFSGDEQKNERLFSLLLDYFKFLNVGVGLENLLSAGLAKFKIGILEVLGLGLPVAELSSDKIKTLFLELKKVNFSHVAESQNADGLPELQRLLSNFITYQLEREVKSEKWMDL